MNTSRESSGVWQTYEAHGNWRISLPQTGERVLVMHVELKQLGEIVDDVCHCSRTSFSGDVQETVSGTGMFGSERKISCHTPEELIYLESEEDAVPSSRSCLNSLAMYCYLKFWVIYCSLAYYLLTIAALHKRWSWAEQIPEQVLSWNSHGRCPRART